VRDLPARGWIPLGERPGTELVYGAVGQPWKGTVGSPPEPPVTAETFAAFAEPGFAKLVESTVVTPYGVGGCVLTLESRVVMTDEDSRRRFRRYWQAAGAVHPVDAPGGDARPGAAVASRRRPQAGAMTPEKAARLRRLRKLNSPPSRSPLAAAELEIPVDRTAESSRHSRLPVSRCSLHRRPPPGPGVSPKNRTATRNRRRGCPARPDLSPS
jgi:hypothetical protein